MALHKPFLIPVLLILMLGATACNMQAAGAVPAPGEPTATSPAPQTVGQCSNPLQPVIAGARWDYTMSGITGGKFTRTITEVHSDGFTDQDVFDSGVTRTGEWKCDQGTLTALSPAEGMSGMVQTKGMTAEFKTTSSSGVTLPAIVRPGDSWTQSFTLEGTQTIGGTQAQSKGDTSYSCKAAGTETVVVAAGSFDAVRVGCQINGKITVIMAGVEVPTELTSAATIWYARDIGMVKTENEISGIGHSTIELTSYTIP
jgi:hypothetical protein